MESSIYLKTLIGLDLSQLQPGKIMADELSGDGQLIVDLEEFLPLNLGDQFINKPMEQKSWAQVVGNTHGGMMLKYVPPEDNSPVLVTMADMKMAHIIQNADWKWPTGGRCTSEVRRMIVGTPITFKPPPHQDDYVRWIGNANGLFTVKEVMKIMSRRESSMAQVWNKVQALCLTFRGACSWEEEITWISRHWTSNSFEDRLKRLALAAIVYEIWSARNASIFRHKPASAVGIVAAIAEMVRKVVTSWEKQ
ncbi:hypothetical protein ACH5RR_001603 [Cinchona calisaya]|uniref:Uncharacterized protein n=1 Tax=Cinchona calisaya TaxID=153742 RepID=A0ABD3B3V3_9GENT